MIHRQPILSAAVSLLAGVASVCAASWDGLSPQVRGYLEAHCTECHDADTQKGEFRIDTLSGRVGFENTPQWLEVMERINSGEMPPKKVKKRPAAQESAAVVDWLSARMKEGESARMAARGRVSYNRLTRDEYVNTVRDLIGVCYDAADTGALLEDPDWHGFERLGSVLTLSPSHIEKYLAAAETILAEAYPATKAAPIDATFPAVTSDSIREPYRSELEAKGLLGKVRYEVWPRDVFRGSVRESLPESGIYEISYKLSGLKPPEGRAPRMKVVETAIDRVLFEQDIVAPEGAPITVTFQSHLPKGRPQIMVFNDVPGLSNTPISGRHGSKPFVSIADGRIPWQIKLTDEEGLARYPFLIFDSVTWRGPLISDAEKARRAEYWPAEENSMEKVREGLGRLARRAFRRPVPVDELESYVKIVQAELSAGEKPPAAVKAGMLAIFCSKSFLFLAEGAENTDRHTLNDWEIASRLSYLLWSTMPDDELFALAEAGKLRDKAELARQTARMLADPRARRFSESFANQWLQLRRVGTFAPDKKLYPDYDKPLEQAMVTETRAFFHEVLHRGLTLREFLHSDWSMVNARLAGFYGLPPQGAPAGEEFLRVALAPGSHRGGLLTHASVLSLTSDGTRHRPVHRGAWLMESIFGKAPPPPPANVEPIQTTPVDSPKATLRARLEAHIKDPRCSSCHARIDPLGIAFDNYDAIGRWRTEEVVEGSGENPPVNPAGSLHDGRSFQTPEEFKQLLLADIDTFNAAFVGKLATYALRRTMSFDDRSQLAAIAAAAKGADYRLRDLVEALVVSDLFQKR